MLAAQRRASLTHNQARRGVCPAIDDGRADAAAGLLYGTGMRLMEALRLRVKDVDFDKRVVVVRECQGKQGPRGDETRVHAG